MAKHCKIKCKDEKEYAKIKDVLDIRAIEYYQNGPGKPIHLCGFEKKKAIEGILEQYGLKKFKVRVEEPDFDRIAQEHASQAENEDLIGEYGPEFD